MMQAAVSGPADPNYANAEAGYNGEERPALGKMPSAATVLVQKDRPASSVQRGKFEPASD